MRILSVPLSGLILLALQPSLAAATDSRVVTPVSAYQLSPVDQARFAAAAARPFLNPDLRVEGIDFSYRPLVGRHPMQDENFYLLTLLDEIPEAQAAMMGDADMKALQAAVTARGVAAAAACEGAWDFIPENTPAPTPGPECAAESLRWTVVERDTAMATMGRVFDRSPVIRRLVVEHMRASGRFHRDWEMKDRDLFLQAWKDAIEGVDRIIRVYAQGEQPRYADIDSPIYPGKERYYATLVQRAVWEASRNAGRYATPWQVALDFSVGLMEINRRDDAVRQLIVQEEENRSTHAWLKTVDWSRYPYAAIVVHGWSPQIAHEPLNPGRKVELRVAVEHYNAGLAPYILVSGAQLRPIGTVWTEAVEMKRFLVDLGFPEDRILISPIDRHTHTEQRDHARLILRTGAPIGSKSIRVVCGAFNSQAERNRREHGYEPVQYHASVGPCTREFTPSLKSFHREATDPMNP